MYNVTRRSVRVTLVAIGKQQILHTLSVFVALVIQHTKRMRCIIIYGLSGSTIFFLHYLINGTIFGRKVTEHKTRVLIFSHNLV
jgi:hypothetical protein